MLGLLCYAAVRSPVRGPCTTRVQITPEAMNLIQSFCDQCTCRLYSQRYFDTKFNVYFPHFRDFVRLILDCRRGAATFNQVPPFVAYVPVSCRPLEPLRKDCLQLTANCSCDPNPRDGRYEVMETDLIARCRSRCARMLIQGQINRPT